MKTEKKVVLYSLVDCCQEAGWAEAEQEFEKEMRTLGIRYIRIEGEARSDGYPFSILESFKEDTENVAALFFYQRTKGKRAGVHIAIFEQGEEGAELTQHSFEMAHHKGAGAVVTLKAVEAVHAAFFEKPIESSPPPDEPPADSQKNDQEEPPKEEYQEKPSVHVRLRPHKIEVVGTPFRRFGIGIDFTTVGGPGGVGPVLGVNLAAGAAPFPWAVLEVSGFFSLKSWAFQIDVRDADSSLSSNDVTLGLIFVRGAAYWNILPRGRLHPHIGAFGGGAFVRVDGETQQSAVQSKVGKVALLGGEARLLIDLLPVLSILVGARVGVFIPEVRVGKVVETYVNDAGAGRFLGTQKETSAQIGRPLAEGNLGFRLRF